MRQLHMISGSILTVGDTCGKCAQMKLYTNFSLNKVGCMLVPNMELSRDHTCWFCRAPVLKAVTIEKGWVPGKRICPNCGPTEHILHFKPDIMICNNCKGVNTKQANGSWKWLLPSVLTARGFDPEFECQVCDSVESYVYLDENKIACSKCLTRIIAGKITSEEQEPDSDDYKPLNRCSRKGRLVSEYDCANCELDCDDHDDVEHDVNEDSDKEED